MPASRSISRDNGRTRPGKTEWPHHNIHAWSELGKDGRGVKLGGSGHRVPIGQSVVERELLATACNPDELARLRLVLV